MFAMQTQSIGSCDKDAASLTSLVTEQRTTSQVHPQYFPDAVNRIPLVLA